MRIAMVSEHASPLAALGGPAAGGQNVHVAELSRALARLGHEVTVHTRRTDPDLPRRVPLRPGVVVEHVTAGPAAPLPRDGLLPYMDDFGDRLAESWLVAPPDVAHAHFWMSGLAARRAAERLPGLPLAQTFHALGAVKRRHQGVRDTSPGGRGRAERELANSVERVIATCGDEVFELVRLGVDRDRISVVPCGVDADAMTPNAAPDTPRHGNRHRLVVLGRLVPRKGIDDVLAALTALPDTELVVAGGPPADDLDGDPDADRLRAEAARLGVADRVRLLGGISRERIPGLLTSADIVVCVPWYEPFGIVPLEAMACGIPVVASAVGGLTDTVVDGSTGRHVPARDPARLAGVLAELLGDPHARAVMGARGRRRAETRYSWARVAADTDRIYRRMLAARPAGPVAVGSLR